MTGTAPMIWELPPLILHPFADRTASETLLGNSRAALIACGLLPGNGDGGEVERRLLLSRFSEIRMLYFLGKDVVRWIGQCMEFVARARELAGLGIQEQSFATLLTQHMPESVSVKLQGWGVHEAAVIFARAIGLNQVFSAPPEFEHLVESFILRYHRYTDHMFNAWLQTNAFREITADGFHFDLYASGEYTKMLESEWGTG